MGGGTLGKAYGIKVWCYWEHIGEHIGNLGSSFGNLMKNPWELDGNTLGIAKTQNFQTPTSPMAFYVCVCVCLH